jgi:hypothetical protein
MTLDSPKYSLYSMLAFWQIHSDCTETLLSESTSSTTMSSSSSAESVQSDSDLLKLEAGTSISGLDDYSSCDSDSFLDAQLGWLPQKLVDMTQSE